jgi:hypothetical protein
MKRPSRKFKIAGKQDIKSEETETQLYNMGVELAMINLFELGKANWAII